MTGRQVWAVDSCVLPDSPWAVWALVGPDGAPAARGRVAIIRRPAVDSARAEAEGVRDSLAHVPEGMTLLTDSKAVRDALRAPGRRRWIDGVAGEIEDRAAARAITVVWRRRSQPMLRLAHRAARAQARVELSAIQRSMQERA